MDSQQNSDYSKKCPILDVLAQQIDIRFPSRMKNCSKNKLTSELAAEWYQC